MKIIKLGLISLIAMALLITGMSLFIPSHTRVSRAITISLPAPVVNRYLSDLRQWPEWVVFLQAEGNGHLQATHDQITRTDMQIVKQTENDTLLATVWHTAGDNTLYSAFTLTAYEESSTVLQWYVDFHVRWYPWEKFGSMLFDKQMGPLMEQSLEQFKKNVKAVPY